MKAQCEGTMSRSDPESTICHFTSGNSVIMTILFVYTWTMCRWPQSITGKRSWFIQFTNIILRLEQGSWLLFGSLPHFFATIIDSSTVISILITHTFYFPSSNMQEIVIICLYTNVRYAFMHHLNIHTEGSGEYDGSDYQWSIVRYIILS